MLLVLVRESLQSQSSIFIYVSVFLTQSVLSSITGNHELDNGQAVLGERLSETNFPWVCSNVRWKNTNLPLGTGCTYHVLERGGIRFGFIGLAPYDWLSTLDKLTIDDFYYEDFCQAADRISPILREQHNCHFIIALTHMRQSDDEVLARNAKDIDLILGGHEHVLILKNINNRWTVKSGTDFKVRHAACPSTIDSICTYKLTLCILSIASYAALFTSTFLQSI